MVMLTWWLSIASGGTVFSFGINRPRAWAGATAARSTRRGNTRRMGHSLSIRAGDVLRLLDEGTGRLDCQAHGLQPVGLRRLQIREQVGHLADEPGQDVLAAQFVALAQRCGAAFL